MKSTIISTNKMPVQTVAYHNSWMNSKLKIANIVPRFLQQTLHLSPFFKPAVFSIL